MKLKSYCAVDLHHKHTVFEAQSAHGGVVLHRDMPTEPGPLLAALKAVPGPKGVVLEEGPMADWAMRVMKPFATEVIVCDPRRNRLIAEDGDKTDDIDPGKLIALYRVGVLRPVHHPERQSIMDLRGWVWAYHDQVELVTAAKNKIKADLRSAGLQYGDEDVYSVEGRTVWLGKLTRRSVRERLEVRYGNLDTLSLTRDKLYERLSRIARRHPVAKRFLHIPGYGVIRAMTFLVMVDTPFRFSSPQEAVAVRRAGFATEAIRRDQAWRYSSGPAVQPSVEGSCQSGHGESGEGPRWKSVRRNLPAADGERSKGFFGPTDRGSEDAFGPLGHVEDRHRL